MNRPSVLVVEDDSPIADAVVYALGRDGMHAERAETLASARGKVLAVELVILDLALPDGSGFSLLGELARLARPPRVIVLTSRDEDADCVASLEAGADDFVTKPFSPRALVARARAVLRRASSPAPHACPLDVDLGRREVRFAGRPVALTKIEFELLSALAECRGRVRTREHLVERVWGEAYALTVRTVDSHVKGLRRKLAEAGAPPELIETVRGVGFKLVEAS
jgi:DNA-binding response OmpR family regulator